MTEAQQRETRILFDFASRCAEQFVSLYYSASDSPSRSQLVPTLYLDTSTIVWNGNPIQGVVGVAELVARMPHTKYEVQGMDCHPMGGASGNAGAGATTGISQGLSPPSLLLTVSGIVTHHTPSSHTALPPSNAPASAAGNDNKKSHTYDPSLPLEALPRGFSQTFVLVHDPAGTGQDGMVVSVEIGVKNSGEMLTGRYFVLADEFRFVG